MKATAKSAGKLRKRMEFVPGRLRTTAGRDVAGSRGAAPVNTLRSLRAAGGHDRLRAGT